MVDIRVLHDLYLFRSLSPDEINELMAQASVRHYPARTVIFREGDPSTYLSVVLSGDVAIIKSYETEVERLLNVLGPKSVIGEMSLLYHEHNRMATACTQSDVRLLEIPLEAFDHLLKNNASLAYDMMQLMIGRMREIESATIQDLLEKNRALSQSLIELQDAQAQLIQKGKMEHELSMARKIQESMLPHKQPSIPGWDLYAKWIPARAVSGDFYDFIKLPDGRLGLVLGDVTDKGVPAALLMTVTRSVLRTAAMQSKNPAELLVRVNNLLAPEMPMNMFVTCQVAFLDPRTGVVQFSNAGHCEPYYYHEGSVSEIRVPGMALGLFAGVGYKLLEFTMQPGDWLLFYSDGLFEIQNLAGEMLGEETVQALFTEFACRPGPSSGRDLANFLLEQQILFSGPDREPQDDITLLSLHANP